MRMSAPARWLTMGSALAIVLGASSQGASDRSDRDAAG